jgi:UDP-N-acetylmuramate dehydrogenase
MIVHKNISLSQYNTFGIAAFAKFIAFPATTEEIISLLKSQHHEYNPKVVIGGGSNILFTKDFEGLLIHPEIKGIEIIKETKDIILVRAGCAENWDDFVKYCVNNDWGGIENLSFIPGTVGASPVQNIGAYGVEVKDMIEKVETIMFDSAKKRVFSAKECNFGYRDSIFKHELKHKCIITHVTFRLTKQHIFRTHYPDVEKALDNYPDTTIQYIREAVIAIRRQKLPDPEQLCNAGSFFKNPVVDEEKANEIRRFYPTMPVYKSDGNKVKLSAAWLIETVGWKGRKINNVGTYKKQPLVIVNYGNASGQEILEFARKIQQAVQQQFAIMLEPEVNIL